MTTSSTAKIKVEQYGLEPVPENLRETKWYEYSLIQAAFSVNAGNFLVPAFAVLQGGLSVFAAIISTIIGAAFAFLLVSALSIPGAKYGIPAQYAIRSILGVRGAQWVSSPIRALVSLYWFSVQTIGGAIVLQEMLLSYFNMEISFTVLALGLGTIMAILAMIGFDAIKKSLKQFFPMLLIGQMLILFLFVREILESSNFVFSTSHSNTSIGTAFFYGSLAFVQYISAITSSSDLTRYAKNYKHGFYGLLIGNIAGFSMTATLGALSAGGFQHINPFVAASLLTESKIIIVIIFVNAMLSMISINLHNAYSGAFCLLNAVPRLGRMNAAIIFGIIAITLCAFPVLVHEAKDYISLLGIIVIPLAAVIVIDFIWIKKGELHTENQQEMKYNKLGLVIAAFGSILYSVIPEQFSPGVLTFLLVGILYKLIKPRFLRRINKIGGDI